MSNGQIPINPGDYPIDSVALDESEVYTVELKRIGLATKFDKGGYLYCNLLTEVVGGDYEGKPLSANYIPLLVPINEDMTKGERIKAQDKSVAFARFARAFKIDNAPIVESPADQERFNQWADMHIGKTGKVTISNQEFPEGSGRMRSSIKDFVVG
jgi:hypothetical protein